MGITKINYKTKGRKRIFYRAEIYSKGVRVLSQIFSTKREEVLWHEKEKHNFDFQFENPSCQMRFKECLERFFKHARCRMMKSSFQKYEQHSRYFYDSPLACVKMSEMRGVKIIEWIDWLKKKPTARFFKRKSFAMELRSLTSILNWYKNYLNEDFHVPITKKHREYCFLRHKTPRRPDHFMRAKDAKAWVEWLKTHKRNPVYYRIATFMLLTGMRVSEACGIKWDAVDLDQGFVRIIRRVSWDRVSKSPTLDDMTKTFCSARLLMLPNRLRKMLEEMRSESLDCDVGASVLNANASGLVFKNKKGEILKYNAIQAAFNDGFKVLNLPWRSTHILRHTFATIALMETKDLSAVQASLGHTEQKITQKYAKTIALLNSETGEKTASAIFN